MFMCVCVWGGGGGGGEGREFTTSHKVYPLSMTTQIMVDEKYPKRNFKHKWSDKTDPPYLFSHTYEITRKDTTTPRNTINTDNQ